MKKIIFTIIILITVKTCFSQTAFYDAQFLTSIKKGTLEKIQAASDDLELSDFEKDVLGCYKKFLDNPFDTDIDNLDMSVLKSCLIKYNKAMGVAFLPGTAAAGLLSGGFAISTEQQTKIIDALAKYYAEEFRKAQLLTYMNTFEATIGKFGELEVVFPKTYKKLKSTDPSRFPELGDEYKSIFNEDLRSILDNLVNHIDYHTASSNPALESRLLWLNASNIQTIKNNDYYTCFKIGADVGTKLINNYHPSDLFSFLDDKYYNSTINTTHTLVSDKIKLGIHALEIMERNLVDSTKQKEKQFSNIWISLNELKQLNTSLEWTYFVGSLYQQDRVFFNAMIFDLSGKSSLTGDEIHAIKTKITAILQALIEVQSFRMTLKEDNLKENFATYVKLIFKVLEVTNFNTLIDGTGNRVSRVDYEKFLKISVDAISIYDNIREKDYSNTIYHLTELLNEIIGTDPTYLEIIASVEKYGSFMSDVINADDSDQLQEIIKKHAAPPTSFILKRERRCTWSITGQPGYFVGIERLDKSEERPSFVSGLTLPIGFDLSFKLKHREENAASLSAFIQIIDIGAVMNFRISDSTSTLPDKIEFSQIFSPGGSIAYGFKNSPVTIGLGYQYTPQLRKVTLKDGNEIYPNGHRIFLRLAWDIPLINIAKSKKK